MILFLSCYILRRDEEEDDEEEIDQEEADTDDGEYDDTAENNEYDNTTGTMMRMRMIRWRLTLSLINVVAFHMLLFFVGCDHRKSIPMKTFSICCLEGSCRLRQELGCRGISLLREWFQ